MPAAATVIIPNFNGQRLLPALMGSLGGQSRIDFDIIVVDDHSTDRSVDYLRRHWPAVRAVINDRNLGFAASVNAGIRASRTPFVVLLNNDTHVDPNWFAQALAAFNAPDIGAV